MRQTEYLIEAIRVALTEKCHGRALDNECDFEAMMEVIGNVVKTWREGFLLWVAERLLEEKA